MNIIGFLLFLINYNNLSNNNLKCVVWSKEQLQRKERIASNPLSSQEIDEILDFNARRPWLTFEQAQAEYILGKSMNDKMNSFKPVFSVLYTLYVTSLIYGLLKIFVQPMITSYCNKWLYKYSIQPQNTKITFKNIAGYSEVKKRLNIIINKIKKQKKTKKIEKIEGTIFYGPPGCGKTVFAEAIANEAGIWYFAVKASDLLNDAGVVGDRLKLLFEKLRYYAKENGPGVLFIDEIDFIIGNRQNGKMDNNEKIVLQELLSAFEGSTALEGVLIIANTNYINNIDDALKRDGRMIPIEFNLPTIFDIKELSLFLFKKMNIVISDDFNLDEFANVLFGNNVAYIIKAVNNINDFINDNKLEKIINKNVINNFRENYTI